MANPGTSHSDAPDAATESGESFDEIFAQYEKTHSRKKEDGGKQLEGTVVSLSVDSVFVDIGFKSEGILPLTAFTSAEAVKPGDRLRVSVKGRDLDGYYELSRTRIEQPKDWAALARVFAEKGVITGTVTGLIKGGFSVDLGVRAFLPGSRSGVRDAAEMAKLVGQEIRCRITKLDEADEDVVVDRRAIAEEEERATKDRRFLEIKEGDVVRGTVRSLADYGAFLDLGGVDGLLHVGEIAWTRIAKPADVLALGQEIEVKVLKITAEGDKRRISVSAKQLQPHPWDAVGGKYRLGERVRGSVTRVMEFGAFVELEPGIEGLIHVSEMSWGKKVRIATDIVKPGETVEAVILSVNPAERRLGLGLKQTLGDPWAEVAEKFAVGTTLEGPITSITKFGAFVALAEGVEGMVHLSEIRADKRVNHPQELLRVGQIVKAQVMAVDKQKRQLRLSMKQLVPTGLDEYIAERKVGDVVTGRVIEVSGDLGRVELGDGIQASCRFTAGKSAEKIARGEEKAEEKAEKLDVSALSSMLKARWKGGPASGGPAKPETVQAGQVRSLRITKLDPGAKKIEVELAS
jgi:small subunit ribosomal protein S1